MVRVFISYRTADTAHVAGRLHDRLTAALGERSVFRDRDSIDLGEKWRKRLVDEVRRSDALLVLMDAEWLGRFASVRAAQTDEADQDGGEGPSDDERRRDDRVEHASDVPEVSSAIDWVRVEIETALSEGVEIIPVIVDGARNPRREQLPNGLEELAERQALSLDDKNFHSQASALTARLEAIEPRGSRLARELRRFRRRTVQVAGLVGGGVAFVASILTIVQFLGPDDVAPMTGRFNIAVAEVEPAAAGDDPARAAENVGYAIADGLTTDGSGEDSSASTSPPVLVWGPDLVGRIDVDDIDRRASELNADMLVHGRMMSSGFRSYSASILVHTDRHNERAPWPIDIGDALTLQFPEQDVVDGALNPKLEAVALTLDGLASLLADNLGSADARFAQVDTLLSGGVDDADLGPNDRRILSTALTLRAWALLVEAGFEGRPELVERALPLARRAVALDPRSEVAEVVSFSADYMSIIPPSQGLTVECGGTGSDDLPSLEAAIALRTRIEEFRGGASPLGQIQAMSFLGRLALVEFQHEPSDSLYLAQARGVFEEIVVRTEGDAELRFWFSDAHRFLGVISLFDSQGLDQPMEHLIEAARVDSPVWAARDLATAGRLQRCHPDGSATDSLCLFEEAQRLAQGDDRQMLAAAVTELVDEHAVDCPEDWEL